MKRLVPIIIFFCYLSVSNAQQQASFTQYMFNGMSINPGYIGTHDAISLTALSRWQWSGVEGAPSTKTLAAHAPVPGKNIGVGFQVMRDQIAVTRTTSILAGLSYKLKVGHDGFLSMGLQGGLQNFENSYTEVYTLGLDPSFEENFSMFKPNIGTGLFYYNPVWYFGASAPLLMNNSIELGDATLYTQKKHYFFTSGVALSISPNLLLKPNILVRLVEGAPLSIDYNLNVLLSDIIWLGVSVRPPESISFLTEINITKKLRVGFAYDHIIDQSLSDLAGSSKEILLGYRIPWKKSESLSPQIF